MCFLLSVLPPRLGVQSSKSGAESQSDHQISGTIEQVSPAVRLIRITSASQPDVTICVEPETKIRVKGREGTLKGLKEGQFVEVLLRKDSSKAIFIDAT